MPDNKPRHPDEVREAISTDGISKAALARKAETHENTLRNVDSPDWNPRWKTLTALCEAADAIKAERG